MSRSAALRAGLIVVAGLFAAATVANADPRGALLVMSDIHFDPFDPPALAPALAESDVAAWSDRFSTVTGQAMSPYGKDTNYALLESSLAAIADAAGDVDLAIVNGDFLAHSFEDKAAKALGPAANPATVSALTVKTTLFVADRLAAALPGKPVFITLGNNDSSCGDYRLEPGGTYLADTREIIRRLAGPDRVDADFDRTYAAGGYYAARHPTLPDTLVLAVNDVLWSAEYQDACGKGGAAAGEAMLAWLRDRLARQKAAGGHVWMIHHIPWGLDSYSTARASGSSCPAKLVPFMKEPFASGFLALLGEYGDVVTASFSGHVHYDDYRLLTDAGGKPVVVDKIAPAVSPVFGQNPGFEIFDYDLRSGLPTDFTAWYLANLAEASAAVVAGDWKREYTFSEAYRQPGYSAAAVDTLWKALSADGPVRDTFRRLYNVGHGSLGPIAFPAYLCAIGNPDPASFDTCYCGG